MPRTRTNRPSGRPPLMNKEQRIAAIRKYVAQTILDEGLIPSIRMLGDTLGYASSSSSNVYAAIQNLTDDPRLIFVKSSWQSHVIPIEIFEAMQAAASTVADSYKDEE